MAKRRASGEGNIRKRSDGRWEGRYVAGHDENGKAIRKNVLGKTQAEVKEKLKQAISESEQLDVRKAEEYTVEAWAKTWYEVYSKPNIRESTQRYYRAFINRQVIPMIGDIKLKKLTGRDIEFIQGKSEELRFAERFNVATAIMSHHYMSADVRREAVKRVYGALKAGGIFICFENVVPDSETVKKRELLRWGRYQQRHGKSAAEALAHNARCGTSYFPITIPQHIRLLKDTGFSDVHVFWYSCMQMGVYAFKPSQA